MIDQHAVALAGQVERDILVGIFRVRAAVLVPHIDRLPILDERAEVLAQAVNSFARLKRQLLAQVGLAVLREQPDRVRLAFGERLTVALVVDAPLALRRHDDRQMPRFQPGVIVVLPGRNICILRA